MAETRLAVAGSAQWSRRLFQVLDSDHDLFAAPVADIESMLDRRQLAAIHWLTRFSYSGGRLAELGAYTGGTTVAFGRALRAVGACPRSLEVYDQFEHSPSSRLRLSGEEGSDDHGFFGVWQRRTAPYEDLIDLRYGDFRELAGERTGPLEQVYVDVVKHESLINPLMREVLPRLALGGYLLHQDYFHWQSPWVVYSTELLLPHFKIVATCSNHMMILQQVSRPPMSLLQQDLLAMERDRLITLMRAAAERWTGVRRGLIQVSLLNLASCWSEFDFEAEAASIRHEHAGAERVQRYLAEVLMNRDPAADRLW